MKKIIVLIIACLALSCSTVQGETLRDRLQVLLEKHERIHAAKQSKDAARHDANAAMGALLPQINAVGSGSRQEIDPARDNTDASVLIRNEQDVEAEQLLFDFGLAWYTYEQAETEEERSDIELDNITQALVFEATRAYLSTKRAYEKLTYARQSEQSIKDQTGIEETLVERGAGLSSDVLQAKQQLAGAQALRVVAEGELMNAQSRFLAVFGEAISEEQIAQLETPPPPFDLLPAELDEAVSIALENNRELLMAQKDVTAAEQGVKIARAEFFPTINAFAEVNRRENDLGITGARVENREGVEASWTLFDGGANYAGFRRAQALAKQAEYERADLARTVEEQIRVAWENLKTFRSNADYLKNQSDILAEFLELARKERTMGERSLLDVLTAEVNHINASSQAVTAEYDTMAAAYNILYITGRLQLSAFE